ncbi:MAG: hypothetical protein U0326_04490 [Polyangiales bacterium]
MTNPLPTVTARGVLAATRAIFMLSAALLTPLLGQYLYGAHTSVGTLAMFAVAGAAASITVSRLVVSADGVAHPALRVLLRGALAGLVTGVLTGLAWVTLEHPYGTDRYILGALFGAIYGVATGVGFGAAFALWTRRARGALSRPSTLASQRLAMEGGLALSLAGALGVALYRFDTMILASALVGFAGVISIVVAIARVIRVQRLFASVAQPGSAFAVAPRTAATEAPALAWAPMLDRVIVRSSDPSAVEPAPFRNRNASAELAVVPSDLTLVRRAIGATVAFGFVAVVGAGMLQAGAFAVGCTIGCHREAGCSGCAH